MDSCSGWVLAVNVLAVDVLAVNVWHVLEGVARDMCCWFRRPTSNDARCSY